MNKPIKNSLLNLGLNFNGEETKNIFGQSPAGGVEGSIVMGVCVSE